MSASRQGWKSKMQLVYENLMQRCGFKCMADLDCRIRALGAEYTLLEDQERLAWDGLQSHDHPSASLLTAVQIMRQEKEWHGASSQLDWLEEGKELFPQDCQRNCTAVWLKLKEKYQERVAYVNLRSFIEDIESSMNLDNCYDMEDWELVKGGDSGRNTSGLHVGVFRAKALDPKKKALAFAVKCVKPEDNTPDEIKRMKREVDVHSDTVHACVLQYCGDYTISSSHFLKFIWKETDDLQKFSDLYSESRRFLFIVSEFCSGGNMIQYVHGFPRPVHEMHTQDANYYAAYLLPNYDLGSEAFQTPRAHHLYVNDHIVMFPPGCNNQDALPYLAKVLFVSDRPDDPEELQEFAVCALPAFEAAARQYFVDLQLECFPDDCYHFHYVQLNEGGRSIHLTLPRPGFPFLRSFCFQAIHALWHCSLKHAYHGDVRLENFFLRQPVTIDDLLDGDDESYRLVVVQLGDFDLATAAKDHTEEFTSDRHQLVAAL
jgi:hypothetical protein